MHNTTFEVKGGKLIITCDVSANKIAAAAPSKTGKTRLVASTGGPAHVVGIDGLTFALNVMGKIG